MLLAISRKWWVVLLRGICMVILGLIAIAWPDIALMTLVILFSIHALTDGIAGIFLGFGGGDKGGMCWELILLGVLSVAAGIMALVWPGLTLVVLLTIIAAWSIAHGVFEIITAIRLRKEIDDEWAMGLAGLLSVAFGVLLLARPEAGLLAMAILIGALMLAQGFFAIALSLRLRGLHGKLKEAAPKPA